MESRKVIERINTKAAKRSVGVNQWGAHHAAAFDRVALCPPRRPGSKIEPADGLAMMVLGWAIYADYHHDALGCRIRDDGHLGPAWEAIGEALRVMLDGDIRPLDGGLMCDILTEISEVEGGAYDGAE